mmetsp:Transcript_21861/g.54965  ORF Transcript_21861/g.54965 Transcript_21861/m.54965 type:complete len:264 (-) Transcript_21861:1525-2316(-)
MPYDERCLGEAEFVLSDSRNDARHEGGRQEGGVLQPCQLFVGLQELVKGGAQQGLLLWRDNVHPEGGHAHRAGWAGVGRDGRAGGHRAVHTAKVHLKVHRLHAAVVATVHVRGTRKVALQERLEQAWQRARYPLHKARHLLRLHIRHGCWVDGVNTVHQGGAHGRECLGGKQVQGVSPVDECGQELGADAGRHVDGAVYAQLHEQFLHLRVLLAVVEEGDQVREVAGDGLPHHGRLVVHKLGEDGEDERGAQVVADVLRKPTA